MKPPANIPEWVHWIARDISGDWWGYAVEPLRIDTVWYENEVGDFIHLGSSESGVWQHSLQRVRHA